MSDHDMHDIRMGAGVKSMELIEALDEEIMVVLTEAQPLVARAIRILLDHGVAKSAVMGFMVGMTVSAVENEAA